jgi:hypothetical protein
MKEKRSLHQKVQEMCDCYATTDPLVEMAKLAGDTDLQEAATKWLALAALHAINAGAHKISIRLGKDGGIEVTARYKEASLPSPGRAVGEKVLESIREITHIEGKKGAITLSLGVRDSSVDLGIKLKSDEDREKVSITFPD